MASRMFQNSITRRWWARVEGIWIGTRPRRRQFMAIVSAEMRAASPPEQAVAARPRAGAGTPAALTALGIVVIGTALSGYLVGRRTRPSRTS